MISFGPKALPARENREQRPGDPPGGVQDSRRSPAGRRGAHVERLAAALEAERGSKIGDTRCQPGCELIGIDECAVLLDAIGSKGLAASVHPA